MAEITIIPAKNHADEIVRTAAYARVSSDSEDQLNSFAAQRYYTELLQNSTDAVFVDMYADATVIIGLKQNPTHGRRFSPIFFA